jgi:hypothetical protein
LASRRSGPALAATKAPNHANYDESLANPFPNLSDALTLKDGQKVTAPAIWWTARRPEIVEGKGIGVSNDYHTEKMPLVNTGLLDGQLAWRQHDGGHTDVPTVKYFIRWADKNIDHSPASFAKALMNK